MAFQLTKFSYKSLRDLNMSQRIAAAQDKEMGQWLLSMLTPTQLSELFPEHYRRALPDVSGFMKAMPSSMSYAKAAAFEEQLNNTATGSAAGANMMSGGWKKKWQEGLDRERQRSTPTRAGVRPPPQLSPEQQKIWEDLRQNPLAVDDPRAKMFAGASDDQLAKAGISRVTEGGKQFFKYSPPTVTEDQAKESIKNAGSADRQALELIKRKEGFISKPKWDVNHLRVGYGSDTITLADGTVKEVRPGMTVSREDAERDLLRRMPEFQRKGIIQYVGQDAWDKLNPQTKAALTSLAYNYGSIGNLGSLQQAIKSGDKNAIAAAIESYSSHNSGVNYSRRMEEARMVRESTGAGVMGGGDYSQQAIQAAQQRLVRDIEARRVGSLAEFTTAQLPAPGSEEADKLVATNKNSAVVAAKIEKIYPGLSNEECVTLAKAYVGATGSVTDWRKGTSVLDGTLQPGTPIATFMRRDGSPSDMYDGGEGVGLAARKNPSGFGTTHAAIFMGYERDGSGKITGIRVKEQYSGSGGVKDKVYSVNDLKGTHNAGNYYSINDVRTGQPLGSENPMLNQQIAQTASAAPAGESLKPVTPADNTIRHMTTPQIPEQALKAMNKPSPLMGHAEPKAEVKTPEAPKVISQKYNVNITQFINKIKEMDWRANMASNDMIISGFNDDPRVKGAGVRLDEKGVMHIKDINHPEVQKIMKDMDTSKFMSPIKEEKKAEVKPPATPEAPKAKPEAVKTNADGGINKVSTAQISAYPIGGLRGDNAVVVDKNQKPLFTMNTNETITMNPKTDSAQVIPNKKDNNLGPVRDSTFSGMFNEFNKSVKELASAFDANREVPDPQPRPEAFAPEGGTWLNKLNDVNENPYHNPTAMRSFYRAGGMETGDPTNGFHFSQGNRS